MVDSIEIQIDFYLSIYSKKEREKRKPVSRQIVSHRLRHKALVIRVKKGCGRQGCIYREQVEIWEKGREEGKRDYVDEAIMKEEAKERSTHAALFRHRGLDNRFHRAQTIGTTFGVEVCRELRGGTSPPECGYKNYHDSYPNRMMTSHFRSQG